MSRYEDWEVTPDDIEIDGEYLVYTYYGYNGGNRAKIKISDIKHLLNTLPKSSSKQCHHKKYIQKHCLESGHDICPICGGDFS